MPNKFEQRFDELEAQLETIESSKYLGQKERRDVEFVDDILLLNWKVKAKNLLSRVCNTESQHFKQFEKAESGSYYSDSYGLMQRLKAIFLAAKEDFKGGHLSSIKALVQAEIFDSELEQASELLNGGYFMAAAVIAGVVLETALRDLCDKEGIPHGKIDKMNADLAKAGVYNKLMQKQITALADIRNSAAHGKTSEFAKQDVTDMIRRVGQFLSNYL